MTESHGLSKGEHGMRADPSAEPTSEQDVRAAAVRGRPWWHSRAGIGLGLVSVIYAGVVALHWNTGYIDFGDGNYLYISQRLAEGATLYRDILAPQPPLHLLLGMILAKAAGVLGLPTLFVVRAASLVLHVLMAWLSSALGAVTWRLSGERGSPSLAGALAGTIYLLFPLGFWWSQGYQSEPLEIIFLYGALWLLLSGNGLWSAALAGAGAALAALTNMTAAPYALFFLLYLAVRERRRALAYGATLVGLWGSVTVAMELATGAYLENVILNQVGSFPRKEFLPPGENVLTYAWRKILSEGRDVLALEGGWIVLALVGVAIFCRKARCVAKGELATWSALALMLSIVYVSKGGTMDYIFTIGEPAVAAFAALSVVWVLERAPTNRLSLSWSNTLPLAFGAALACLAIVVVAPGLGHISRTLWQETYELDEYRTRQVVDLIRQHSRDGEEILAPPFYAFLAGRKIVEDYSEIFLWTLKYFNERQDRVRGRGVATVERIAQALEEKRVAFVALDLDQTGRIPEIRSALERHYEPLRSKEFRTLNTRLMFYKPRE